MNPIKFDGCNATYAEHQPEYIPLPCLKDEDGTILTIWKASWWERLKILFYGKVRLYVMTFNKPLQPVKLEA